MADERIPSAMADQVIMQVSPAKKQKKKPSWLRTVLWMLSMVVLANILMGGIAYFLFFHNK